MATEDAIQRLLARMTFDDLSWMAKTADQLAWNLASATADYHDYRHSAHNVSARCPRCVFVTTFVASAALRQQCASL